MSDACSSQYASRRVMKNTNTLFEEEKVQPSSPNVRPGMGNDVRSQVSAPRRQNAKENPKHGNNRNVLPSLVSMADPKHNSLKGDRNCDAPCECQELLLKVAAVYNFL